MERKSPPPPSSSISPSAKSTATWPEKAEAALRRVACSGRAAGGPSGDVERRATITSARQRSRADPAGDRGHPPLSAEADLVVVGSLPELADDKIYNTAM